jgi:hypothetical protein
MGIDQRTRFHQRDSPFEVWIVICRRCDESAARRKNCRQEHLHYSFKIQFYCLTEGHYIIEEFISRAELCGY